MAERTGLLVLGLGNVLCGDDGLGVAAVRLLAERYALPEGVLALDGGTLGLSLLPHLEDADAALFLDAVRTDAPPGSLVRIAGEDVGPAVAGRLSPHQVGVADLLDAARWRGRLPARLVLLGMVPSSIELRLGLSAPVAARLPELTAAAARESERLGFPLRPRTDESRPFTADAPALLHGLGLLRV